MILLNDARVLAVQLRESGEEMVSLAGLGARLEVDWSRSQIASNSERFCYARRTVGQMLVKAAQSLPQGLILYLKEAYRPYGRQIKSFEESLDWFAERNPGLDADEIYRLTCQYVAPPQVAGHPTGGAVDVTLMRDGHELDMGCAFNEEPEAPRNLPYTECPYVSEDAQANRKLLADAMSAAGFVNYPSEWWHWSYGDAYWGFVSHNPACYTAQDETSLE
ncbi:M15 family metallopeptidase [Bombiscardovia apis]|nr:M15 family metallopeptidase [Bombiscardovia apis]